MKKQIKKLVYKSVIIISILLIISGNLGAVEQEQEITPINILSGVSVGFTDMGVDDFERVNNEYNLNNNTFQKNDINLTYGTVGFAETDLHLPGKNGLDLSISRVYNSRQYISDACVYPVNSRMWGAYAGQGWSFSIGDRKSVV